jgi:hypothetical protein
MKSLIICIIIIISCGQAHAQSRGELAKVFSFSSKIKNSDKAYSCTATLINYQGQCHLLTNNHCVENKSDFKINFLKNDMLKGSFDELESYSKQYAVSDDTSPISVTLKKVNHRLDLAVLTYNSKRIDNECSSIDPISLVDYNDGIDPQLVKTFVATGVVNNKPMIKFTSALSWAKGGFGATQVFYKYALGGGLYFWHVSDIDIIPGMSGSPIVNNINAFIGLASKYVDFQSSALIIPTPMILDVLDNKVLDLPEIDQVNYKNNIINDAGNEHGGAGNEHGGAGNEHGGAGNEHGGAGNEHGGAGGNPTNGNLQSFRAPDEGILVNNEILLGFTSKDGILGKTYYHQIDGHDEYQIKINNPVYLSDLALKGKINSMIKRPANGFPELDLRKKLLERLDGFYYLESKNGQSARPFNQKKVQFLLNPKAPRGMEELERKTTVLMLDIDSKKNKFTIESEHLNLSLDITFSADYKQVYLTKDKVKLVCENKHLLKLVCSGEGVEFSVSLNHTAQSRYVKYRLAYNDIIEGYPGINYWFGAVGAAPNPEAWRIK